jgi:hypothetical protein
MNPIAKIMKRYIKTPLKYALPLLFIGALVLVSISGCTSPASTSPSPSASSVPTATPMATATPKVTAMPTATATPTVTVTPMPSVSPTIQLVGDSATHVYHLPSCRYVPLISPAHLVYFNSAAQAKAAGYRPCKVCDPPDP